MISDVIAKLQAGTDLSYKQINEITSDILSGKTTLEENMEFLSHLADKGETDDELLGMLDGMQDLSHKIKNCEDAIDMCGTGGDMLQTFNISTAASFVVAAAGGRVAKHGNRSNSGFFGSADVFEYFGCDLSQAPSRTAEILDRYGICFMFAQKFHPAMKQVGPARKKLGRRTAFNLLGPLSNPACVKDQIVGVSSVEYLSRIPAILRQRGARNVITVRSDDGMDEFSTSATNRICILQDGKIQADSVDPETVGLHRSNLKDIQISTKEDAVRSFVGAINGTANRAILETTALNAAAGLIVAGLATGFKEAAEVALGVIMDGKASKLLERFVRDTGDIARLRDL